MPFDDVRRQAQAISAQASRATSAADARRQAELAAEEDFRESLRELGRWFATEARSRSLVTVPFYDETPKWKPARWSKGFAGFGARMLDSEGWAQKPAVDHGWALFPLTPSGGIRRYPGHRVGGRKNFDEMADQLTTYHCLAVNSAGDVRQALAADDAVYFLPELGRSILIGLVQPIDRLTRSQLATASGLTEQAATLPFGLTLLDPTYEDRSDAAYQNNLSAERNVLSYYVAHALRLLGNTEPPASPSPPLLEHQPMPMDGVQWHVDEPKRLT